MNISVLILQEGITAEQGLHVDDIWWFLNATECKFYIEFEKGTRVIYVKTETSGNEDNGTRGALYVQVNKLETEMGDSSICLNILF